MTGVDVVMSMTDDGGEIDIVNGQVALGGSLETCIVNSLFGGNADDPGNRESSSEWWGNRGQSDRVKRYRSQTQHLLRAIPATSGNLLRVEDAIKNDLSWMLTTGAATSIDVSVSIPALNRIRIELQIDGDAGGGELVFEANWRLDV